MKRDIRSSLHESFADAGSAKKTCLLTAAAENFLPIDIVPSSPVNYLQSALALPIFVDSLMAYTCRSCTVVVQVAEIQDKDLTFVTNTDSD